MPDADPDLQKAIQHPSGTEGVLGIAGEKDNDTGANMVVGTVVDVTTHDRNETRDGFLLSLDDAVRAMDDPDEITLTAATLLGRLLNVDRCAYADVESDEDTMNLSGNYLRGPEIRSIVGRMRFADFGEEVLRLMRADEPYVVHDVDTHVPPVGDPAAYRATQIQAVICVPLQKNGRFVAAMAVHCNTPRRWTPDEVDLVRAVASRCWESIERTKLTRTLRESEARYRTLFEAVDQGFCVAEILLDPAGAPADYRFLEINSMFEDQTGLRRAVGKTALELVPALDPWWVQTYGGVALTGKPVRFESAAPAMARWFDVHAFRFGKAEDRQVAIFFKDITARKRSEARDRLLIDLDNATRALSNPDEITRVSMDLLGRHLDADRCANAVATDDSDTFEITYDYVRGVGSVVGRYRLRDFGDEVVHRFHAGESFVVYDVETHTPPFPDLEPYRRSGIRAFVAVPLLKGGRLVAIPAVHQATPRRWSADEIELVWHVANRCWESIERAKVTQSLAHSLAAEQTARAEAERAGRIKDDFLASLSHELRTPLNAILGWSQLLRSGPENARDLDEGLAVIERNARAQTQIIGDLLDMSRIVSGKLRLDVRRVDLTGIVREAVETIQPAADAKGVRIQTVLDPAAGIISGDPSRLQQVFWNLLSNAVKFTPRNGRVQIVIERVNSHVDVVVTDTGEGISPDFVPHVFDRFRQADASTTRRHGGLGLGLAIARQLVELHGGTIRAHSPGVGHGSTFRVSLPLAVVQPGPVPGTDRRNPSTENDFAPAPPPEECVSIEGVKVLVVDDEPDARTLVQRLLEDCHAVVTTAASVAEALRAVESDPPDVLVSDIGMPGADGYTLIQKVRSLDPDRGGRIPAVALTAYARSEDRTRSIAAGFHMHVAKPVEPAELITVVASLAGRTGRASGT